MKTNNFSVLMSVYYKEQAEFLRRSLDSILNQTVLPSEIVLVKDGALSEELDALIDEYEAKYDIFKIIALPQNVGLGAALNEGLKHCSYDLVARMDSDDICLPRRFELQLEAFRANEGTTIIGGWIEEFSDDESLIEGRRILPETHEEIAEYFKSKSPLNHMTVMFVRPDILSVGGYEDFYLMEDYWLWARLLKANMRMYNIQETLVLARGGTAMAARRGGWKYAKSEIRLQRALLSLKLISPAIFLKNCLIRFIVRMMPNKLRLFVYEKALRA